MLALIAGAGALPALVAASVDELPLVVALEGFEPDGLEPKRRFRLETLGTTLGELAQDGVDEVCFAGAIRRPEIDPGLIDAATLPLIARLGAALKMGDDGALRTVLTIFEEAGFTVRAAHDLVPSLLPPEGVLTSRRPEERHDPDIERAVALMATLGASDVGQSCVVHAGQVLAIEGVFGTDWMLRSLLNRPDGRGGVFYKAQKPGQDRRADLPVIGVDTVEAVARAGLDGMVLEAGGVMMLDRDAVVAAADEAGLFLWVRGG